MKIKYFEFDILEKEIVQIPLYHQIAFAASVCERMLPNYCLYAQENNRNGNELFRESLNEIWLLIETKSLDRDKLEQALLNCEAAIPDEQDNHFSSYVPEAQNATIAVCNHIEMCLHPEPTLVTRVVRCAHNTLWEYLDWQISTTDEDWNEKLFEQTMAIISAHTFTIREIAKENEDLQYLKETSVLTREFLKRMRTSSQNNGVSLICLSLN